MSALEQTALNQIITWMKKRSSTSADLAQKAAAELAALRAERDYYKNNASAWKEYADHQEYCAECAVDVDTCETGSLLKSIARVKITDVVMQTGDSCP